MLFSGVLKENGVLTLAARDEDAKALIAQAYPFIRGFADASNLDYTRQINDTCVYLLPLNTIKEAARAEMQGQGEEQAPALLLL